MRPAVVGCHHYSFIIIIIIIDYSFIKKHKEQDQGRR